jgi:hypothetical protein
MNHAEHMAALRGQGVETRNRFADGLAENMSIAKASEYAGISPSRGKFLLKEFKDKYGWQAV